jgi:hypothetical protein
MFALKRSMDALSVGSGAKRPDRLFLIGVHGLLQRDAELLAETLEL